MPEPLCGHEWFEKHKNDYIEADIAQLGIEISFEGSKKAIIHNDNKGLRDVHELVKVIIQKGTSNNNRPG